MKTLFQWQGEILKTLAGRMDDYCLGGGTALSKVYFHHRQSYDLDFFALKYSRKDIFALIDFLTAQTGKDFKLTGESRGKGKVSIMIFEASLSNRESLKIDFIDDYIKRLKPAREVDGIWVFSLEDIYLRKVYAVTGTIQEFDEVGRKISKGGRQEAKDFYDLYFLSYTFMNLSDFAFRYCNTATQELIIHWFRTYPRLDIKTGLLELRSVKKIDYKQMEGHFKEEIDNLLDKQIGKI